MRKLNALFLFVLFCFLLTHPRAVSVSVWLSSTSTSIYWNYTEQCAAYGFGKTIWNRVHRISVKSYWKVFNGGYKHSEKHFVTTNITHYIEQSMKSNQQKTIFECKKRKKNDFKYVVLLVGWSKIKTYMFQFQFIITNSTNRQPLDFK